MSDVAEVPRTARRALAGLLSGEWRGFAAVTIAVVAFYVSIGAPVLDPPNYLDPWIYTALFVNFKFIYQTFRQAYYPTRLPWVIPGIVAHAFLPPVAAFFVLHAVFFFGAGIFVYLLVRRFAGPWVALATYGVLMLSPLFYDAYSNDYPDGALLTYLFGGVYFALTAGGSRRPWLRAGWAGFFLAAAIGTNLFAGVVITCLLLLYAAVRIPVARDVASLGLEIASAAAGAVVLLVVCGTFAKANGGEFLFFMPSVRAISAIDPADYKARGYSWMYAQPQLLVPAFLVLCVLVLVAGQVRAGRWRHAPGTRFALGAAAFTASLYALIAVWEFRFTGNFLETPYYFSLFNVGIALCVAAALYLLRDVGGGWDAPRVAAVIAASLVPTVLVLWVPVLPVERRGAAVVVVFMAVALVALGARRAIARRLGAATATVLGALIVFSASYAADAGSTTAAVFERNTFSERRDVQNVAMQLIAFMRDNGLQHTQPAFWYNARADGALNGIQSTYLWGLTWIGLDMPRLGPAAKQLLENRRPANIVLLCKRHDCRGGPAALARAGYDAKPVAEEMLAAGSERVWARAFALPKFAPTGPTRAFYEPAASPFAPAAQGRSVRVWSLAGPVRPGWSGASAAAMSASRGGGFTTSSGRWEYEVVSPPVDLPAGAYTVYLRGRVLAGGLDLGVLDADASSWIQQRFYWFGQKRFGAAWMATPFTLESARPVKIILSNWVPEDRASRWALDELRLVRTK